MPTFDSNSAVLLQTLSAIGVNVTGAHTINASATGVVLLVESALEGGQNDNLVNFSVMTESGSGFTQATSARVHAGGGTTGFVDIYTQVPNAGTGSQTMSITNNGGVGNAFDLIAWACSVTGAFTLGAVKTVTGSGVSSQTLTWSGADALASGDLVIGICCNGTSAPGVTTGTSIASQVGSTGAASHNARIARNTGTGTVSLVFSTNAGDSSAATGIRLIASGGAAPAEANFPPIWSRVEDVLPWDTRPYEVQPAFYWWDNGPVPTADTIVIGRLDAGADFPNAGRYDIAPGGRLDVGSFNFGQPTHNATLAGILEAGAILYVPSTHDATLAGILEAAVVPYGPVSHDATLVGLLEAGAFLMTGPSADVSVVGLLETGAVLYAPVTGDRNVAAHLPAGAYVIPATTTHQVSVAGHLPAAAVPYSIISHLATVAGLLPAGPVLFATATADRTVVAHLAVAAFLFNGPSGDVSVIGLLEVGAFPMAGTFRRDITPTGTLFAGLTQRSTYSPTISPSGLLEAAVNLQSTVSTTRSVAGILEAGAAPAGGVTVVFTIAGRLYVGAFPNFDVSATFIDHAAYVATALERFFDEAREAFADTATETVADEGRERDQGDSRERFTDGSQA